MRLSQKKNCNGCKAGWYESQPFVQRCSFNVPVESTDYTGIPQEPCYKPMTNRDVLVARELMGDK